MKVRSPKIEKYLDNMEVLERWMLVIFEDNIWEYHRVVVTAITISMELKCYCYQEFLCDLKSICGLRKFQFCVTLKNIWSPSERAIWVPVIEPVSVLEC